MAILVCRVSEHGVVVDDEGKVLVLRSINSQGQITDKWVFPGGRLEEEDKPGAALLREIKEETGLENVEVLWPVFNSRWGSDQPQRYSVIYLCRCHGPHPIRLQLEEHPEYKWLPWNEAMKMPYTYPAFQIALGRACFAYQIPAIANYNFLNSTT